MLVHAVGPAGTNRSIDIAPSISFQLGVVDDPTAWGRALDKTWSAHHKWNHFSITFPVSATPQPAAAIRNFSCRSGDGIRKGEVPGFLEKILLETYGAGYWDRLVCLEWDCKAALRGEAQPPKAYKELIRGGMREEVYAARSLFLKASERGGRVKVFVVEEPELGFTVPECWKGRGFVALCKGFGMVASMASR